MKFIFQILFFFIAANIVTASDFGFEFEWGNINRCEDGNQILVNSPWFKLINVPAGTTHLIFEMKEKDNISFQNDKNKIKYHGSDEIEFGEFKYKGPCPDMGSKTYTWEIKALNHLGKEIGKAKSNSRFPEVKNR